MLLFSKKISGGEKGAYYENTQNYSEFDEIITSTTLSLI